jgi:hypothetical protein
MDRSSSSNRNRNRNSNRSDRLRRKVSQGQTSLGAQGQGAPCSPAGPVDRLPARLHTETHSLPSPVHPWPPKEAAAATRNEEPGGPLPNPTTLPPGGVRVRTLDTLERWEVQQARKVRGNCAHCGHSWRPRNPSTGVNRCPGCGTRGRVSYAHFDPDEGPES